MAAKKQKKRKHFATKRIASYLDKFTKEQLIDLIYDSYLRMGFDEPEADMQMLDAIATDAAPLFRFLGEKLPYIYD